MAEAGNTHNAVRDGIPSSRPTRTAPSGTEAEL